MADIKYILGTIEYLMLEIEVSTPGFTFTPSDWEASVVLVPLGETLDTVAPAPARVWSDALLETVDDVVYAKVLLGDDPIVTEGVYQAFVALTATGGDVEVPLLKASGLVTVDAG